MALPKINPTKTVAWQKLIAHFQETKNLHLRDLFYQDKDRKNSFSINLDNVSLDYSKNRITQETINLLVELANEVGLKESIEQQFTGAKINEAEDRAVLHTVLRSNSEVPVLVDGKDIKPKIKTSLRKIRAFSNKIISGKWKGFTGKPITDVVNIGVGGSELGASFAVEALRFYKNHLNTHFVSNVDGDNVSEVLKKLNPETTLFIIVSKSFKTQETIINSNTIRDWFLKSASVFDVAKHFVAVSENIDKASDFGIDKKNVFPMWNWVGGRFSLWSSVGLSISLSVGYDNFKELLNGAEEMDIHYRETDFNKNIPVILALLSVWYNNFYNSQTEAILSYTQYLKRFIPYLQQGVMESNGKGVDRNGDVIDYQTGTIIFGGTGTNIQHEFMQLVHQGTKFIPTDFIGYSESLYGLKEHHEKLMANYYAQTEALAFGKTKDEVHLELKTEGNIDKIEKLLPFKVFEGNRPSNSILFKKLTPNSLGMLISLYEHKIFTQGILWNIYSYDQFGVELGKQLAEKILKK